MNAGLVALALRRALPLALVLPGLALLAFVATRGSAPSVDGAPVDALRVAADARAAVWIVAVLVLVPALLWRAAEAVPRWRHADADWRAPRIPSRAAHVANELVGLTLAAALALGAVALAAELASSGGAALRFSRTLENAPVGLLGRVANTAPLGRVRLDGGSVLRFRPTVAPGAGPAAELSIDLVAGGEPLARARARVHGRSTVDLRLDDDVEGELVARLGRDAERGYAALPARSVDVLVPSHSVRLGSLELWKRALLALMCASALALGLGAWLRPVLAFGLSAGPWVAAWAGGSVQQLLPGGDLMVALALVGEGVVPAAVPYHAGIALVAIGLAGIALAQHGLSRWRSGA